MGLVVETPEGKVLGADALITSGLTEKQARDIMEHLRLYCGDFDVRVEQE